LLIIVMTAGIKIRNCLPADD